MEQSVVQRLIHNYGPVKWVPKSIFGFRNEGWFLIETVPIPPMEEIELVVSDIMYNREIDYKKGQVRHWKGCSRKSHPISDKLIKKVLSSLKAEKYRIAVCTGDEKILEGQPIVIALRPLITYVQFPDHPHLNTGGQLENNSYLPDSLCYGYTAEKEKYGPADYEKFIRVFDEATLWLFRHQVWKVVRNTHRPGKWIGPGDKAGLQPIFYAGNLNPLGRCRCGAKKRYKDCHLHNDIAREVVKIAKNENRLQSDVREQVIKRISLSYNQRIYIPQKEMIAKIDSILSNT